MSRQQFHRGAFGGLTKYSCKSPCITFWISGLENLLKIADIVIKASDEIFARTLKEKKTDSSMC